MKKTSLLMILAAGLWACGGHSHEDGHGGHDHGEKTEDASSHEGHDHGDHEGHDHGDHEGHDHGEQKSAGVEIKPGQSVYWISPKNEDIVKSPFKVEMGVKGMEVEPAGHVNEDKGHHHILVNKKSVEAGVLLEQGDPTIIHYGQGQTEAEVDLEPGVYLLTLQFANGAHESYGPDMSETIEIKVE